MTLARQTHNLRSLSFIWGDHVKGPFWKWDHEHIFEEKDGITTVTDQIDYKVPFGFLGEVVDTVLGGRLVKTKDRQDVQGQRNQTPKGSVGT